MPEKFVQAAIITFLLQLIFGLSSNTTTVHTKAAAPSSEASGPVASSMFSFLE